MKLIFLILLAVSGTTLKSQIPTGTYVSDSSSFRAGYFLKIDKDSAILLGWETTLAGDTIYFKGICKREKGHLLTFVDFIFSKVKNNPDSFNTFVADRKLQIEISFLNRYFFEFRPSGDSFTALSVKDVYDSRADAFEFVRLE